MKKRIGAVSAAVLACSLSLGGVSVAHAEGRLLGALFTDHAVLQRDRPIRVFGHAKPDEQVSVMLGPNAARATADAAGSWAAELPAMPAGGPFTLTAKTASESASANDVLLGDVWLCSGQSNMEFRVRSGLSADVEAAESANDRIRNVTIARDARALPLADFATPQEWQIAAPSTTPNFSAVCYYFVRELQKTVNVPMGMIHSSWGGTRIEAWTSAERLLADGRYSAPVSLLGEYARDRPAAYAHWGETWQKWWSAQPVTRGTQPWAAKGATGEWKPAPAALGYWEAWGDPALKRYDGILWYRTTVNLTAAQARQSAKLSLSAVTHTDLTFVNGRAVGTGFEGDERVYPLPPKLLKAGDNVIAVAVENYWGNGGITGDASKRALLLDDGSRVALAGWQYQIAPAGLTATPQAPWGPLNGVEILYNGMIAPLGRYGLRGVAWYQGEANAAPDDALRYESLLGGLFADWRRQFDAPLPFFVVQLTNFGPLARGTVESGWARLRDGQRRAVAKDGNAGLAVIIDIGNRDDIHPTDKQDVGKRLAREARRVSYGEKDLWSGAQPQSARHSPDGVTVTFGDFSGGLEVIGAKDPSGFELCGAAPASCRFVSASLGDHGVVRLSDPSAATATRVRFCWADSPLCDLFDAAGFPVGPFELEVQ